MKRHSACRISLLTLAAAFLLAAPSSSFAQAAPAPAKAAQAAQAGSSAKDATPSPSHPMRVAFIDTSGEKGDDVYNELDKALAADKNVERIDKEAVTETAKTYKLEKSDFRDGNQRAKRKGDIDKFMNDLRAEALIIVDVIGRGRKAQLVVVDSDGKEISDQRTSIRKYKIKSSTAESVMQKAIKAATPAVIAFRQKGGWAPDAPPAAVAQAVEEEPVVASAALPAAPVPEPEPKTKGEGKGFQFSAGVYGSFGMTDDKIMEKANKDNNVAFTARYPGFVASINATYFFNDMVGVGLNLFGGYSPFTTKLIDETNNTTTKLSSYVALAQAQLEVPVIVAKGFRIVPFVGGDFHKLSIKQLSGNPISYTGSQYIGVRGGLHLNYRVSIVDIGLGGAVLPTLKTVIAPNPDDKGKTGLYGDPTKKFVLAYEGRLTLAFRVLSMLDVVAGYNFRYTSLSLKNDKGNTKIYQFTGEPVYRELDHLAFIGLRYVL